MEQTNLEIVSFDPTENINLLRLDIQEQIKQREEMNFVCKDIKLTSCACKNGKNISIFFAAIVLFENKYKSTESR